MIRILLDADGLLRRFGRPVPDAVGLVAALMRLQGGLARGVRPASASARDRERRRELAVDIAAVRFGSEPAARTLGPEFADLSLRVLADAAELAPGDLYFTTSHARFAAAQRHGATAYKVGLGQADGGRGVDFSDVPRVVEEALRIPTARPMSPASRRGGLLAIPVASRAQARMVTLGAIRSDLNADWTVLADHLLLYTENPDLEDQLAERPGVRRLSYGVRRDDLVFDREDDPSATKAGGSLFGAGGIHLRETSSGSPQSPRGETGDEDRPATHARSWSWHDVRRQFLGPRPAADDGAASAARPESTRESVAAYQSTLAEMEEALRGLLRAPIGETILPALNVLVGPEAAADAWSAEGFASPPQFLAWQTPYARPDRDDLLVLLHRLRSASGPRPGPEADDAPDHHALRRPMAAALATATFLSRLPDAPGAVHVLDLRPTPSDAPGDTPAPASVFLLTEERSRAHPLLELRYDDAADLHSSARLQSLLSLLPASGDAPGARA